MDRGGFLNPDLFKSTGEFIITEEQRQKLEERGYSLVDLFKLEQGPQERLTESGPLFVKWIAIDDGYSTGMWASLDVDVSRIVAGAEVYF